MNVLNLELKAALADWLARPGQRLARAVLLTGAGKAFCAVGT